MQTLSISEPSELKFDCNLLKKRKISCSQAFPDLIKYEDKYFLTFRTAPNHFPSSKAEIHVFSSTNTQEWKFEHTILHDQDMRDPHFLAFKGELYLFFTTHSRGLFNTNPENIYHLKKTGNRWTQPTTIYKKKTGFWNVKPYKEKVYMSIYYGKDAKNKKQHHIQFISSKDLANWEPVFDSPITRETLGIYQTSEAAFEFDEDGNIFGTIRSIIYPNLNFFASSANPEKWKIKIDKFKCDGPQLFKHKNKYFLIARRSLFYKLPKEPFRFFRIPRKTHKIIRYSLSRKRTAVYQFNHQKLEIKHIADLPSHGDTGYAAVTKICENKYLLVYYSSDISTKKDFRWLRGQISRTKLYSLIMTIH